MDLGLLHPDDDAESEGQDPKVDPLSHRHGGLDFVWDREAEDASYTHHHWRCFLCTCVGLGGKTQNKTFVSDRGFSVAVEGTSAH